MGDTHQEPRGQGQFFGEIGRTLNVSGLTLSDVVHHRPRRMPQHVHAAAYYSLVLAGTYREVLGRQEISYGRAAILYHPPDTCHWDEIGQAGGRLFIVELGPAWHERLAELDGLAEAQFLHGGPVPALGLRLFRELHRADACTPLVVEGLMLEMLGETARRARRPPAAPPAWLPRVLDCLRQELGTSWTLAALGQATGVEAAELSRAFRRHQGETVGEHQRRMRVAMVCERLAAAPEASLADLAAEAGFADQSHLTRIFRRLTGTTPGAFQASLRRGPRPS